MFIISSSRYITIAVSVEKDSAFDRLKGVKLLLMLRHLRNVILKLPTDGFIQCPLRKLIHHEMAFRSSKLLLQQIPVFGNEKIRQPNSLQQIIDFTANSKPTFAAQGAQAPAYCYQEQGGSHRSRSNPSSSAGARGPLECDRQKSVTSHREALIKTVNSLISLPSEILPPER